MKFDFNEDQQMLADSARNFLRKEYGFADRQAQLANAPDGFDRKRWAAFGELGWLGIAIPEAFGGLGQDIVSAMALVEVFGEHLVVAPFVESALEAAHVLSVLGSDAQKQAWLPRIAGGDAVVALAHAEPGARFAATTVAARAERTAAGYILSGVKSGVPFGQSADQWIVTARTSGGTGDAAGISVFLVDPGCDGITVDAYRSFDETPTADIHLDKVEIPASALVGTIGGGYPAIEGALAVSLAAACVEAVGAMSALHNITLDYVKVRQQFGTTLGSFQVIQHRLADVFTKVELARPLAWLAVSVAHDPVGSRHLLSAAKAQVSDSCRHVGETAVHLHGGIGMTDEIDTSHYYTRLVALEKKLGDRFHHLGVIAAALAAGEPTIYA